MQDRNAQTEIVRSRRVWKPLLAGFGIMFLVVFLTAIAVSFMPRFYESTGTVHDTFRSRDGEFALSDFTLKRISEDLDLPTRWEVEESEAIETVQQMLSFEKNGRAETRIKSRSSNSEDAKDVARSWGRVGLSWEFEKGLIDQSISEEEVYDFIGLNEKYFSLQRSLEIHQRRALPDIDQIRSELNEHSRMMKNFVDEKGYSVGFQFIIIPDLEWSPISPDVTTILGLAKIAGFILGAIYFGLKVKNVNDPIQEEEFQEAEEKISQIRSIDY